MKIPTLFVVWTALVMTAVPLESKGQDTDFNHQEQRKTPQWTRPIHASTQYINV
jgi:hypothetical protein